MMRATVIALVLCAGCTATSGVMETSDGAYLISARAAPAAGGAAGASGVAFGEAQQFCAAKKRRAVLDDAKERDVYQGAAGGHYSRSPGGHARGGFSGGFAAAGSANIRFRCVE